VTYPSIIYQKGQTGYLVTHPSQIRIYNLLDNIKESPRPEAKATTVEGSKEEIRHTEKMQPTETVSITRDIDWAKNTAKTVKGFYIPFLLLALLVIVYPSPFRASLTRKDIFPLIYITLNIAMFFPTNVCNSRYFQTVIPLYLHLAALGVLVVGNILTRYSVTEKQLKILAYLGLLVLALLAQKECDFLKSDAKMREDQTLMEIGRWIAKNRNFFPSYGQLVNGREYHNGRLPVILSVDYRIAYYASSDCVILPKDGHVTPEKMADFCLQNKVSLILYDRKMEEFCPGFGKYWPTEPDFKPVEIMGSSPPYAEGVRLLTFDPDVMKNAPPLPKIN